MQQPHRLLRALSALRETILLFFSVSDLMLKISCFISPRGPLDYISGTQISAKMPGTMNIRPTDHKNRQPEVLNK